MNLTALTPCCVDYYPQLGRSFPGGNSLNVAAVWKQLSPDAAVSVITCLGNDESGDSVLSFLTERNIDTSRVYRCEGTTATNQLRVDEHGERFGIEGTWSGGVYETFHLSDDDWKFVSRQDIVAVPGNNPNFKEMLAQKADKQFLVVDYLDVLNNVPVEDSIAYTDIAFISSQPSMLDAFRKLAVATKKLLVVSMGAHGSRAFYDGNEYSQSAFPVKKVVDTTGCGDAYLAAFSLYYFKHRDIQKAMYTGASAAADVLTGWSGAGIVL